MRKIKDSKIALGFAAVASLLLIAHIRITSSQTSLDPKRANTFTILMTFGLKDDEPTVWDGNVRVVGGELTQTEGYRFLQEDRILSLDSWKITSDRRFEPGPGSPPAQALAGLPPRAPNGVILFGVATSPQVKFHVTTAQGNFSFALSDLKLGEPLSALDGAAQVELLPAATKLTDDYRADDFPSVAVGRDGAVWVVWASFNGARDQIRMRRFIDGRWEGAIVVPARSGDVWRPQVAVDSLNRPWVVWSEQVEGNWDLYASVFEDNRWQRPIRLTDSPLSDFNHQLISDSAGNLWIAWQSFRSGNSDIFLKRFKDGEWSREVQITSDPANDWEPAIAVDKAGRAHIVWDTYRNGNYDVYMRSYDGGVLSEEKAVAATPQFEAHASVACDQENRVWVAWDVAGANWGKDQGYTIRQNPVGITLYGPRRIGVKCFVGGAAKEPVGDILDAMPEGERNFVHSPRLLTDKRGGLWMLFLHRSGRPEPPRAPSLRGRFYWEAYIASYEGDRWSPAVRLPKSWNRISSAASLASGSEALWLAWPTDNRTYDYPHRPVSNQIYAGMLPLGSERKAPALRDPRPPEPIQVREGHADEPADVRAIRAYRVRIGGKEHRIVRGDLHRHTELSWDGGGGSDGSLPDFYRYMLDAAAMDFGASTDHQGGGEYDYYWWYTQKLADIYHVPGSFIPLYGYERSVTYPNGHRNVLHAYRGVPVVSFFYKFARDPWPEGVPGGDFPGVEGHSVVDNDTKLLYESLRRTKGIAIPHTSATRMGTDWRDNDPEVEPVVEIFQGARTNYEHEGAPKSANPEVDKQHLQATLYKPDGFVWKAWAKGYRLGTITSSDHGSTHMSYAMVYTDSPTRDGILDAIRRRHTYGATDNIILEFWIGNHFMGDEFAARRLPPLRVKAIGTGTIARVHIIKNNAYIYSTEPKRRQVEFTHVDNKPKEGLSYYYVRVEQEDGQMAWSSPIWVNYER